VLMYDICGSGGKAFSEEGLRAGGSASVSGTSVTFPHTSRGIESAAARMVLTRLRAFADISPQLAGQATPSSDDNNESDSEVRMVAHDVFAHVVHAMGIPLTDEDVLCFCDSTDTHP